MKNVELIKKCAEMYLNGYGTFTQIQKDFKVNKELVIDYLRTQGYVIRKGIKLKTVLGLFEAEKEYIALKESNQKPSITAISKKYNIATSTLSNRLKELNIEIINYQNITKFNEQIFDNINTEEKAYWLGFIYADGYISSSPIRNDVKSHYVFGLSLKGSDIHMLEKFNNFMEYQGNNVEKTSVKFNDKIIPVCKWTITNKHLWEVLNSYGCVPNKSLILEFPLETIFESKNLIKHFIRGYIDGDGCISYSDATHQHMEFSVLGTEQFLNKLQEYLPISKPYKIYSRPNENVKKLSIAGKPALKVLYYLYEHNSICLDRKYQRYKEFRRLYEESYKKLQTNIGEDCDVNPEINSEIKESASSYSVQIEPEKSE